MTNDTKKQKPSFINRTSPLILVLIGGTILFFLMLMITPDRDEIDRSLLPWNSVINEHGNIEVLGIETNATTAREVEWMFRDDVSVKVFFDEKQGYKFAEMMLPSIRVEHVHAALVLRINVTPEKLEMIYNRGIKTTMNKMGIREVIPSQEDGSFLKNQTFSFITLLPRRNLTDESIRKRFGEPEKIVVDEDRLIHWFFPEKGLKIIQSTEGRDGIIYQIPLDYNIIPAPEVITNIS